MKTIGKHIISYLLASMFLVSFTGMRLLIHHCMACDTKDLALLGWHLEDPEAMHRDHAEGGTCQIPHDATEGVTCCDTHDNHGDHGCGDCCQSEVHYLRAEFKVTPDKHEPPIEPVQLTLHPRIMEAAWFVPEKPASLIMPVFNERPPPRLTGRDFVIYAHHLKIS